MDFYLSFPISTTAIIFTFLVFLYYLFFWIPKYSKKKMPQNKIAPKVGGAWPIIGHLHLLGGPKPPHITLGFFADKYGPIFSIRLGVNQTLVVACDSKMAKECLTTNDKVFATRPKTLLGEIMGYNYAVIGLGAYGQYWRQVRKIMVLELLSGRSLHMHAHKRLSEIKLRINEVYEFWVRNKNNSSMVKMEMKECFGNLNLNIVVRMLVGKRYSLHEEEVNFQKAMKTFLDLSGTFMVLDAVPYRRWLDLGGYDKLMRKTAKGMDDILEDWLKEHKTKRNSRLLKGEEQDFMDAMLADVDGGSAEDFFRV